MANRKKRDIGDVENPVDFLDTGSTLLNLAASQKGADGGWARGRIVNIVGDGGSGKTLLALQCAAKVFPQKDFPGIVGNESYNFPKVKNVEICYNNVEGVMDFPIGNMYGKEFGSMIRSSTRTGTIQEFGRHFLKKVRALKDGDFLLYIIDSWDALDSEEELEAFIKSIEKDSPMEGSYDLGKQKYGSKRFFKTLCNEIEGKNGAVNKDCTLMIISHVKQKIGVTFGEKRYRTGGDALNFYTHQVVWLHQKGIVTEMHGGQPVATSVDIHARFKRNKTALPFREADFPILFNYGIDNLSSLVSFLYGPKSKKIKGLFGQDFDDYNSAISYIDSNDLESDLINIATEKWHKNEALGRPDRKRKFPV